MAYFLRSYDAEGNRIAKTDTSGTTRYVIDPHGDALPRVLVRTKPDGSITRYVYGIGLLYEVDESDAATYYHYDQSGSTIALTDISGAVTDRVEYSPYGTITHRTGSTDTPFLYAGQFGIQQDANGLLYMRARYYNPTIRRFINQDPIGFAGGMNWYAYAGNNPIMYVDPSGNVFVIGAFIGAAIDYGFQVGANFVEGDDFFKSLIDVNVGSIAASAALGATGAGLGTVATGAIAKAGLSTSARVGANALANGLIGSGLSTVDAIGRNQFRDPSNQIDVGKAAGRGFLAGSLGSVFGDAVDIFRSSQSVPAPNSFQRNLIEGGAIQHYSNPNLPTTGQVFGLGISNTISRNK